MFAHIHMGSMFMWIEPFSSYQEGCFSLCVDAMIGVHKQSSEYVRHIVSQLIVLWKA